MNKKIIIGAVVIVALIIIVIALPQNKTEAPAPEQIENENTQTPAPSAGTQSQSKPVVTPAGVVPETLPAAIVRYTKDGFTNSTVTISKGGKVRFINESGDPMWVASDPHPSHSAIPAFDQKRSVGNGGTYEFTFTEIGTWYYHNHMNPVRKGRVIVKQI